MNEQRAASERRYFWDFFGPNAEGTARHFKEHLDGFLAREGIADATTGVVSEQPGHWAAYCDAPSAHEASIAQALRPRRYR